MQLSDTKYLCQQPFINGLLWRILSSIWKLPWHKIRWVGQSLRLGMVYE